MTTLPTLYSRTSTGATQRWTMYIDKDAYWTVYGQVGGAEVTTKPYKTLTTNEGRANERDSYQQALFEAQQIWQRKTEAGYFIDIKDIDNEYWTEPMLAKNYKDRKKKVFEIFAKGGMVFVQPKFDGARCVISQNGAFSRNGKPWMTVLHILEDLKPVFEQYPGIIFDGELYNHALHDNFDEIMSLIKRTKPTDEDLLESAEKVQFHIYDIVDPTLTYSERLEKLTKVLAECVADHVIDHTIVICSTFSASSEEMLDEHHGEFVGDGYEGSMIRLNEPYELKRSSSLLKRKDFDDAEFKIIEVIEGLGNKVEMAGAMLMENPGYPAPYDTFRSNIKGPHSFLKEVWKNRDSYAGKWATVKYFGLGAHGGPRFPYIIKFREAPGVD